MELLRKDWKQRRASGVLLHITSLPSPYGIGTLGRAAYDFVDFLEAAGQTYWQVLPLGPTGYGDSPYQSFSAYAGNPYWIDLDILIQEGLLLQEEVDRVDFGEDPERVDYEKIFRGRFPLLLKAYERRDKKNEEDFVGFKERNAYWLKDYCLYSAIKEKQGGLPWTKWDEEYRFRNKKALTRFAKKYKKELDFVAYQQYLFFSQWQALKRYAEKKDIYLIGDIPIYVAMDSADAWANSRIFELDEKKRPIHVGGCPPDDFSNTGQLWGNPLYRWDVLKEEEYGWWVERMAWNLKLFHVIRIDHFRGFESYWRIPAEDDTAVGGHWKKGPAMDLFRQLERKLGALPVIAEDLGYMTQEVYDFRKESGFPGMKILQFAFPPDASSDYLPHRYDANCVVYTGTHDNDTLEGWRMSAPVEHIRFAREYFGMESMEHFHRNLIRGALASVAFLCVFQMQDFLRLDNKARMNRPGTVGDNWVWRMKGDEPYESIAEVLKEYCRIYGR